MTAPPVAADGKVFVMDAEGRVVAMDAASGSQIWRTGTNPGDNKRDKLAFGGGMAYADGKLYVSSGYREVLQMDARTGAVGWRTKTPESIHGAPTVSGGRVFAISLDNTLLTFDAATGAPSWTYQALSESARILSASSPAISGDSVVAAFGSGELVALRASNGNDLWNEALSRASRTSALSEIRDIPGRPVIYQGDVFAVNDTYLVGAHLNDVDIVSVYVHEGKPVGFGAIRAHWEDVGAATPGHPAGTTEIYQEGLRIPPVRVKDSDIMGDLGGCRGYEPHPNRHFLTPSSLEIIFMGDAMIERVAEALPRPEFLRL